MTRTRNTYLALMAVLLSPMAANADPIFFDVDNLPDILSISVNESGVLGEGWEQVMSGGFFPTFTLQETEPHIVTVSFDSGRMEEFTMEISPSSQQIIPFIVTIPVSANFSPLAGTSTALNPLTGSTVFLSAGGAGPFDFLDDLVGLGNIYDPDFYRLTEVDGVLYDFRQGVGLQGITDTLGQRLLFGPGGVLFTSVIGEMFTSLDGFALTDRQGNLVSFGEPASVPEPGTLALQGIGLAGMGLARRRKKA